MHLSVDCCAGINTSTIVALFLVKQKQRKINSLYYQQIGTQPGGHCDMQSSWNYRLQIIIKMKHFCDELMCRMCR